MQNAGIGNKNLTQSEFNHREYRERKGENVFELKENLCSLWLVRVFKYRIQFLNNPLCKAHEVRSLCQVRSTLRVKNKSLLLCV